jgi:hypothetical protein
MCSSEFPYLSLCFTENILTEGSPQQIIESKLRTERRFSDRLYNLSPEQVALKQRMKEQGNRYVRSASDVHLYTFSEMERIEWKGLFRCYRPMKLIPPTFHAALYAEHIQRIVAVFEAYDLEFKDKITETLRILQKFDPTFSFTTFEEKEDDDDDEAATCSGDVSGTCSDSSEYRGVKKLHDRIMVVHNEELYDNPEAVLKRVMKFANLDPSCMHEKTVDEEKKSKATKKGSTTLVEQFESTFEEPHAQILKEAQEAAGGKEKLTALEYGRRRCAASTVDPGLIAHVFKPSIDKFEELFGAKFWWDEVSSGLHRNEQ